MKYDFEPNGPPIRMPPREEGLQHFEVLKNSGGGEEPAYLKLVFKVSKPLTNTLRLSVAVS